MIKLFVLVLVYLTTCCGLFTQSNQDHVRVDIKSLVFKEKRFSDVVHLSVTSTRTNIKDVWRQYEELSTVIEERGDRTRYLGNLLNLFSIIHRLVTEWTDMFTALKAIFGDALKLPQIPIPIVDLWKSGLIGLVRVQEIYNISTEVLVSGNMPGTYPHANLTAGDCFAVARVYYQLNHHERAVEWLLAALRRAHEDKTVSRKRILEYLHLAQCFKGDHEGSTATNQTLRQETVFTPSEDLLDGYSRSNNQTCSQIAENIKAAMYDNADAPHFVKDTAHLCRKQWSYSPGDKSLKCRLIHYNHPHLKISPFKVEELHLDPPLLLFYDVIHNKEMEHFKTFYHNKTKHAMEDYGSNGDYYQDTQYNTWIRDEISDDILAKRLTKRSGRITNMDLSHVEKTMVASYGLAGEIKSHFDFGAEDPASVFLPKSRADYATLMYYLNDVEEGGKTVFPWLNLAVVPVQGSAILWLNRKPDWSKLVEVEHSGCPILRGSKWIIVKWFHVLGQDFPKCVPGKEKSYKYYYL